MAPFPAHEVVEGVGRRLARGVYAAMPLEITRRGVAALEHHPIEKLAGLDGTFILTEYLVHALGFVNEPLCDRDPSRDIHLVNVVRFGERRVIVSPSNEMEYQRKTRRHCFELPIGRR